MVCVLLSVGCKPATLAASPARIVEEDPALPGLGPGSPVLAAKLRAALLAKGAAYRPRTRHLNADGSPKYTNRLILESSPYLLQHAHNPVNWYPWGDEAFARAKREGKPIFLSVGYSTCHWCHVMEVESFEDEEIARYLNEHYVAIKVDREERPDIDAVYMSAVESLTGRYVSQRSRPRHDRAAVADRLIGYYGVTPTGNFDGRNILYVPRPDEKERDALSDARAKLYAARARRIPPARDDKILAGWNGLMISALALGGRVLGDPRYTTAAERAADFVLGTMRTGGLLARSFEDRHAGPPAFLEDYAFLAAGLFDLYEASFDPRWLREALALCAETETLFADPATGGWFATGSKHEKLLAREKPSTDGAIPSGTSVAILNALRAATFTGDDHCRAIADRAFGALREPLAHRPDRGAARARLPDRPGARGRGHLAEAGRTGRRGTAAGDLAPYIFAQPSPRGLPRW